MNPRVTAAVVFGTAATLSAAAALAGGFRESAQCGAIALLTLGGWAMARAPGPARWWLPAGLALLALAAVQASGPQSIGRDRMVATVLAAASVAFLVALRSLPGHPPSRRRSHAALLVAAVPVLVALINTAEQIDAPAQILPLIVTTAPAWAATIGTAAVAGLAVLRADHRYLLPAGALILAGSAGLLLLSVAGAWLLRWTIEHPPGSPRVVAVAIDSGQNTAAPSLTRTGTRTSVPATSTVTGGGPDPWSAAAAVLVLLGPALLTAGAIGPRGRSGGPE